MGAKSQFDSKTAPPTTQWSGRLALHVDNESSQSFAALFELRGNPERGELVLTSPIGSTLGEVRWTSDEALLLDGRRTQRFASVEALTEQLTGAALPLQALFQWMAGTPASVPGWRAALDQVPQGRIQAMREQPLPRAQLNLIFEPQTAPTAPP